MKKVWEVGGKTWAVWAHRNVASQTRLTHRITLKGFPAKHSWMKKKRKKKISFIIFTWFSSPVEFRVFPFSACAWSMARSLSTEGVCVHHHVFYNSISNFGIYFFIFFLKYCVWVACKDSKYLTVAAREPRNLYGSSFLSRETQWIGLGWGGNEDCSVFGMDESGTNKQGRVQSFVFYYSLIFNCNETQTPTVKHFHTVIFPAFFFFFFLNKTYFIVDRDREQRGTRVDCCFTTSANCG